MLMSANGVFKDAGNGAQTAQSGDSLTLKKTPTIEVGGAKIPMLGSTQAAPTFQYGVFNGVKLY